MHSAQMFQQTVEVARRVSDGARIAASDLLTMSEAQFTALRRTATESIQVQKNNPTSPPFLVCDCCGTPLWLTRRTRGDGSGNRFFKHTAPAACPWFSATGFNAEQILAMRFHGAKEGSEHRLMKGFIAWTMGADPRTSQVVVDRVHYGKVLTGEWKRPDVRCTWNGLSVVFEVQLSYTFISEVVKRDVFYRTEKTFVIWVFKDSDDKYAFVKDEKYFNKQNLFVLDDLARQESERRGRLVLHCYYTCPELREDETIVDRSDHALVELAQLTLPADSFRPFFHDYDLALTQLLERKRQLLASRLAAASPPIRVTPKPPLAIPEVSLGEPRAKGLAAFRNALIRYGKQRSSDPADLWPAELAVDQIAEPDLQECARRALKYPLLDALLRMLSIEIGMPLVTRYATVYQVLDASLQASASTQRQFAWLYLELWKEFHPAMKPHQSRQLTGRRDFTRTQIAEGNLEYFPDRRFLQLVVAMFPGLKRQAHYLADSIASRFSITPAAWEGQQWTSVNDQDRAARAVAVRLYAYILPAVDWSDVLMRARNAMRAGQTVADGFSAFAAALHIPPGHLIDFLTRSRLLIQAVDSSRIDNCIPKLG